MIGILIKLVLIYKLIKAKLKYFNNSLNPVVLLNIQQQIHTQSIAIPLI